MKRAPNQPVSAITLYGGCFLKSCIVADAGTLVPQHAHRYDHTSFIFAGRFRIWQDDRLLGDFAAPSAVKIPAGAKHRFLSLCDGAAFLCIHATDAAEIEIVEEHHLALED